MAIPYYLIRNEKEFGPFSGQQLRELALIGRIQSSDHVRKGQGGKPVAARQVKGLFEPDKNGDKRPTPPPVRGVVEARSSTQRSQEQRVDSHTTPAISDQRDPQCDTENVPTISVESSVSPKTSFLISAKRFFTDGWERIRRFFKSSTLTTPVETTSPDSTPERRSNILNRCRVAWSEFRSTAKAAKELAAAQTRKAKLTKIDLPAAHLALGKYIFESSNFNDEFAELYEGIEKAKAEIGKLGQPASPKRQGADLKDKVRAGAANLKAKGQQKAVSMKLDSLYRDLGQKSFQSHGEASGIQDVVAPVVRCFGEIESLDREIARLAEIGKGKLLTPKRLIIGAFVVGVLLIFVVFTSFISGSGRGASGKAMALLEAEQRQQIELTDCEPGSRADAIQALVVLSVRPAKVGGMQTVQATSPSVKDRVTRLLASFEDADRRSKAIQDRAVYNTDQKSFLIAVPFHTNISIEDCKSVFGSRASIDARTQLISGMSKPSTFVAVTIQCSDGTLTLTGNDLRKYDVLSIMQFYPGKY